MTYLPRRRPASATVSPFLNPPEEPARTVVVPESEVHSTLSKRRVSISRRPLPISRDWISDSNPNPEGYPSEPGERTHRYEHLPGDKKDAIYFENGICQAASSLRRSTKSIGASGFRFCECKNSAWASMLQALINAKLRVVASWPIDTERAARTRAQQAASLQSSVHIVCPPGS